MYILGDSLVMGFSPDCVHFRREAPGNFWGFEIISCWSNLVNIEFYSDKKAKYVTFTGEYQTIMRIAFCVHFRKFPILCTFSKMSHFVYIFENFRKCPILCTFLNLIFGQKPKKKKNNNKTAQALPGKVLSIV